jgi:hypothetical protein
MRSDSAVFKHLQLGQGVIDSVEQTETMAPRFKKHKWYGKENCLVKSGE